MDKIIENITQPKNSQVPSSMGNKIAIVNHHIDDCVFGVYSGYASVSEFLTKEIKNTYIDNFLGGVYRTVTFIDEFNYCGNEPVSLKRNFEYQLSQSENSLRQRSMSLVLPHINEEDKTFKGFMKRDLPDIVGISTVVGTAIYFAYINFNIIK